jgi:hypothetical protein
MSSSARTKPARAIGWVTLVGGTLVVLFWVLYFTTDVALGTADPRVSAFESAFLLADAAFGAALFAAGYCLLKRKAPGPFLLVVAASISIYLGLLDLTFYGRHGLYGSLDGSAAFELGVNAACVLGGLVGLNWGWKLWRVR